MDKPDQQRERRRLTRRQLLAATGAAAVVGVRGSVAAGQIGSGGDPVPTSWSLAENGRRLARFSVMVVMELAMDVPSKEAIQAAEFNLATSKNDGPVRLPGIRRPPSVLLRLSADVTPLQTWIDELEQYGAASAKKTLQLIARDANGTVLSRFRLRNAIPARVAVNGLNDDAAGTFVEQALILCTRIEIL